MNPLILAALRRHWQLVGALATFVIFTIIHLGFFLPAAKRYQTALENAGGLQAVLESGGTHPMLPPRLYALMAQNSLAPQDAVDRGGSGALGVILLEDLDHLAQRSGLTVLTSEPGAVTQEPLTTQVRAHLRLRGNYAEAVAFFGELARLDGLTLVERFQIGPSNDGGVVLDAWLSRLYLKQSGGGS
jgi:hypothetical protein